MTISKQTTGGNDASTKVRGPVHPNELFSVGLARPAERLSVGGQDSPMNNISIGRVVKNVLDEDGKLSIVQSKKNSNYGYWNYAKNFQYTAAGGVSDMQLGNGTSESTTFNSRLQPTQIALGTTIGAVDKLDLAYEYNTGTNTDNNGNVLKQTINVLDTPGQSNGFTAVQTYTYDDLNRLKSATETGTDGWTQTFQYDRYGNKNFDEANTTTLTRNCGTAPNLTICDIDRKAENPEIDPTNNRIKELQPDGDSVTDYEYDNSGNTTKDPDGRTFIYDGENKQIEVRNSSGNPVGQYFYDGDGKRVKKHVPSTGETTVFHYDAGGKLIAEYSTIVETTNPQVSYLTNDHLGSPRITTDKDGRVHSRRDFMPFGEELTTANTAQRSSTVGYAGDDVRQKFTGYERDDETELDFAQARMHNFSHGRFTSPDPLLNSGRPINPKTWNRYAYSLNNPLKFVDPSGLYENAANTTDKEKKRFEKQLKGAKKQLAKIGKRYGADSTEYKNASRALNAYGDPNKAEGMSHFLLKLLTVSHCETVNQVV